MKIIIKKDYQELSKSAAILVKERIKKKPDLVLGLATGSTPLGLYQELIRLYEKGEIDFSQITTFNLDEYLGLEASSPNSYHFYMFHNFFNYINIKKENIFIPKGITEKPKEDCLRYEEKIKEKGGIDLQILGIGSNGHIGFNEPGSSFRSLIRVVSLNKKTIRDNARFFKNKKDVPKKAISMGIRTILSAKEIVLLASGEKKSEIIEKVINKKVTKKVPASCLKKHKNVTFIIDQKAASKII